MRGPHEALSHSKLDVQHDASAVDCNMCDRPRASCRSQKEPSTTEGHASRLRHPVGEEFAAPKSPQGNAADEEKSLKHQSVP